MVIGRGREFIDFAHCVCTYTTLAYLLARALRGIPRPRSRAAVYTTTQSGCAYFVNLAADVFEDKEKEGPFEVI